MSEAPEKLPNDPDVLKAMIAALQVENSQMSATLRAHELLVQSLRIRIAKLQKQKFGASSEKIEREIKQLELALEDLQVATAEADTSVHDESDDADAAAAAEVIEPKPRRRPRVSDTTPRERRELDPGNDCPDCGGDLRVVGEDVSEHRKLNWRRLANSTDLAIRLLRPVRFRAKFAWQETAFPESRLMSFRGEATGTGWRWGRGRIRSVVSGLLI